MRLLLIGGGGHLGSIVRPALEAEHTCRYLDTKPVPGAEDRTIVADVNDDEAMRRAVDGVDAVLYMALGAGEPFSPTGRGKGSKHHNPDAAMDVNVLGLYRALHYGLSAGVRRFVQASSLSIYHSDGTPFPIDETRPPDAWTTYGLTKRLAEVVCLAATQRCPDATVIALRLMAPQTEEGWANLPDRLRNLHALGPRDAQRLYLAAVQCDTPGFHPVQIASDVNGQDIPHDRVAELTGWTPRGE